MANGTTTATAKDEDVLVIPEETTTEFPELVAMVKASRSMDDEERQYWIDVLPIMSGDQIENLQDILDNERKQVDEANKSYQEGMNDATQKAVNAFDSEAYKEKKRMRLEAENVHEVEERENEENLLAELENL